MRSTSFPVKHTSSFIRIPAFMADSKGDHTANHQSYSTQIRHSWNPVTFPQKRRAPVNLCGPSSSQLGQSSSPSAVTWWRIPRNYWVKQASCWAFKSMCLFHFPQRSMELLKEGTTTSWLPTPLSTCVKDVNPWITCLNIRPLWCQRGRAYISDDSNNVIFQPEHKLRHKLAPGKRR